MNVSDFLELKDINVLLDDEVFCDGKVLALYSEEKENYTSAIEEKMKAASCNKLIVVYSHKKMEIQRQLQEYEVLQEIKTDTIFFANEENKVLEKEIPIIEEDLSKEIEAYLEYAFGENSGKKVFYFEGDKLRSTNKKRVTDIVDLVCEEVYYATVSVNNELINKQNISTAPIKKARKTIMETLINGEDTEVYMSGTSAESTIYRALFVGTGIRNGQYAHNVERVIDIFNDFIASACDCKKCMSNLLDVLTKEPIGMRKGIIPIYLAYVLSERNEDVVIYFGKKEQQLTSDILLNMCEYPEDYYIFVSSDDVRKEQYLSAMGQLFDAKETTNKSESRIAGILLAMQRWFRALPQVTKNIKKNNVYWNNDAIAQAFPKIKILLQSMDANPYEVIFVELPKVVGSDDYSDICNILAELRQKANNYLSWISQRAVEKTIETFDKKAKQDLHHTMIEWYEHQSDFAKHGLHSSQVTGLMTCIAENSSYDDVEFVKRIIRAVTDIHLDTWNEASLEEYISMLKAVKEEIENLGQVASNNGKNELSFVGNLNLMEQIKFVPPESIGTTINNFKKSIRSFDKVNNNDRYFMTIQTKIGEILRCKNRISEWEDEIKDIEAEIEGKEDAKKYQIELNDVKKRLKEQTSKKENAIAKIAEAESEKSRFKKIYDQLIAKSDKGREIRRYIAYAVKIQEWLQEYYNNEESMIRKQLEDRVNAIFTRMYHGERILQINEKYQSVLYTKIKGSDELIISGESEGLIRVKNFAFIAGLVDLAKEKALRGIPLLVQRYKKIMLELGAHMYIIKTIKGDITKPLGVQAIVNAANSSLLGGGGVDGAIHRAAGPELLFECRLLGGCKTGQAKLTKAYNLPCDYIIHTVGPVWNGGKKNEEELLASCYYNAMQVAMDNEIRTIAFPSISTGIYHFPVELAAKIAVATVARFLSVNEDKFDLVEWVLFDENTEKVYENEVDKIYRDMK